MFRRYLPLAFSSLLLVALCLVAWSARGQQQPAEPDMDKSVRVFMRAKLDHSQHVLEGLTIEDYELIAKHANQLKLLSQEATWHVLQTPEYTQHSADFRRSVDRLQEAATQQNLDGSTLAYLEVTMRCVECHKYVRRVRIAQHQPEQNSEPRVE